MKKLMKIILIRLQLMPKIIQRRR